MTSHVWTAGPFRGWPLSDEEEQQFIAEAHEESPSGLRRKTPSRSDVTTLVVALRDGATYRQLREFLPGFKADAVIRAHEYLSKKADESRNAWEHLVSKPTRSGLTQYGARASVLLPIPVADILRVASTSGNPAALEHAIHSTFLRIAEDTSYAHEVEDDLCLPLHSDARKARIGSELFHPQNTSLWGGPYYVPRRVADLSPLRVMDILGERTR